MAKAQDTIPAAAMPIPPDTLTATSDTLRATPEHDTRTAIATPWHPDPNRATWMAVIFPGLGQIYNRSYWKLPIVYGGLMGCAYAITWNSSKYTDYLTAYKDILLDSELSTDPQRSYNAILPKGYTIERMGGRTQYTQTLNDKQNLYRRYRDISIAATAIVYVLSIIDAYVDAQLFDYDISPDLSMNIQPQIYQDPLQKRSAELKVAFCY